MFDGRERTKEGRNSNNHASCALAQKSNEAESRQQRISKSDFTVRILSGHWRPWHGRGTHARGSSRIA